MTWILLLTLALHSFAGELGAAGPTSKPVSANAPSRLGDCQPPAQAEELQARRAAETAGLAKEEMLARLIFSESLSTGYWKGLCNAESGDAVMKSIGWGIMNRVKAKATSDLNAYTNVIFGKNQFRTSFSGKKENPFAKSFLCPLESEAYLKTATVKTSAAVLYQQARQAADNIVREYENSGIPVKYRGITNFFYPQSEFFGPMRPAWAPNKDFAKNKGYVDTVGAADKPCVESYRLK